MSAATVARVHLHREDCPATLRLLEELRHGRPAEDWALIGYTATVDLDDGEVTGAWVDWEELASSWLSSTEKAVVHIARGCAVLERAGGPGPRLRRPIADAVGAVLR